MTLCLKYHCAFFHHRPQIKSVLKHGVTFEDHKHSRLKEKKKSCTLPQPDLDSPTAFWLWLWCHLSVQVIIALSAACVLARSLPDWLWKHLWIEKKKKSPETCISHRNTSSSGIHYRPYGNMFFCCLQPCLLSPSLWLYLLSSALIPLTGDSRAIKSLVPGLLYSKGCGHRQVCVGVV